MASASVPKKGLDRSAPFALAERHDGDGELVDQALQRSRTSDDRRRPETTMAAFAPAATMRRRGGEPIGRSMASRTAAAGLSSGATRSGTRSVVVSGMSASMPCSP